MDKPDAYQKGWIEFYKLRFKVTPDVLIPRPETELLVDEVLNFVACCSSLVQTRNEKPETITVLDIGTGSGNIAISVAKNAPNVKIIATDISQKALKIAQQNAKLHGIKNRITFIQSDLLNVIARSESDEAISETRLPRSLWRPRNDDNIDIIVTNLPYIPTQRIPHLDSSVKDFEPHLALDGGKDGFDLYRKLFQQISLPPRQTRLVEFDSTPQGWKPKLIICEIDYTHGKLAVAEAKKYFPNAKIEIKTDLAHKQRILIIKFI